MHIHLESTDEHSVQSYSDREIKINHILYQRSLVLSPREIITDWDISGISQMNESCLSPLLLSQPRIIIIGHTQMGKFPPRSILQTLAEQRIGLECMSIGAACRTFNVLLSEDREVVLGIIMESL